MHFSLIVSWKTWFCQILVQERREFLDAIVGYNSEDDEELQYTETDNWPYKIARLINLALTFMAAASSQVNSHCFY